MVLTETQDRQILVNPLESGKPEPRRLRFSFFDSLVKEQMRRGDDASEEAKPLPIKLDTPKASIVAITRGHPA
jgi:hypothetical protein